MKDYLINMFSISLCVLARCIEQLSKDIIFYHCTSARLLSIAFPISSMVGEFSEVIREDPLVISKLQRIFSCLVSHPVANMFQSAFGFGKVLRNIS